MADIKLGGRYRSRHPKYHSASPRGILDDSSGICPLVWYRQNFPRHPQITLGSASGYLGATWEILLKYLSSPQIPLGCASGYLGWLEVFQAIYYSYLKYPRAILYKIPGISGIPRVFQVFEGYFSYSRYFTVFKGISAKPRILKYPFGQINIQFDYEILTSNSLYSPNFISQ